LGNKLEHVEIGHKYLNSEFLGTNIYRPVNILMIININDSKLYIVKEGKHCLLRIFAQIFITTNKQ